MRRNIRRYTAPAVAGTPEAPPGWCLTAHSRRERISSRDVFPAIHVRGEGADERQVTVALGIVEAVADNEGVVDIKARVSHLDIHRRGSRLAEHDAYLDGRRIPRAQVPHQPGQGQAGVDDVLDHKHVTAGDVGVQVLEYAYHPG